MFAGRLMSHAPHCLLICRAAVSQSAFYPWQFTSGCDCFHRSGCVSLMFHGHHCRLVTLYTPS